MLTFKFEPVKWINVCQYKDLWLDLGNIVQNLPYYEGKGFFK